MSFLVYFIFIVALTLNQRATHQPPLSQNRLLFDMCLNPFQEISTWFASFLSQDSWCLFSHIWMGVSPNIFIVCIGTAILQKKYTLAISAEKHKWSSVLGHISVLYQNVLVHILINGSDIYCTLSAISFFSIKCN